MIQFGEHLLDRIEVGRVFRQEGEVGARGADGFSYGLCLVAAEVIYGHDIAGLERGDENFHHVEEETLAIDEAGQPARQSHDYKRNGTTSLFATLDIATGRVIGKCYGRHRAAEFRKFPDEIEAAVPSDIDVHLVMNNYATQKTPLIQKRLVKRPRWHVHLTRASLSWLNQVECFFALLTDKKIRRGIYRSVAALRTDIASFIDRYNADPKPFRWNKSADGILASIERFYRYNAKPTPDKCLLTSSLEQ